MPRPLPLRRNGRIRSGPPRSPINCWSPRVISGKPEMQRGTKYREVCLAKNWVLRDSSSDRNRAAFRRLAFHQRSPTYEAIFVVDEPPHHTVVERQQNQNRHVGVSVAIELIGHEQRDGRERRRIGPQRSRKQADHQYQVDRADYQQINSHELLPAAQTLVRQPYQEVDYPAAPAPQPFPLRKRVEKIRYGHSTDGQGCRPRNPFEQAVNTLQSDAGLE